MAIGHYDVCIDLCNKTAKSCDELVVTCLGQENAAYMRDAILAAVDCAAFCRMAAGFMARDSQMAQLICEDCSEICMSCAEEFSQHPAEHFQICVTICRECANECLKMGTAHI